MYCMPFTSFIIYVNCPAIYRGVGCLELLILVQGNARARRWDKREVEHPRLSHFFSEILLTAESGLL